MSRTLLSCGVLASSALATVFAGVAATPATAAQHGPQTHKLAFTAHHTGIVPTSRREYVLTDNVMQHGQQVGADVLSCRTAGHLAHCAVTLAFGDGQMRLRITLKEDGDLHGKVVGGEGAYAGATGHVRGSAASEKAERVVVRWRG